MTTAESAAGQPTAADRLGIQPGTVVQEIGRDDDSDPSVLEAVLARAGTDLVADDSDDVVDAVLLWWRDGDGDLVDALVDARTLLDAKGSIWVLTPKAGRVGHVEPSDLLDAAPTAGLVQTSTAAVSRDWSAQRLVVPKGQRATKTHRSPSS